MILFCVDVPRRLCRLAVFGVLGVLLSGCGKTATTPTDSTDPYKSLLQTSIPKQIRQIRRSQGEQAEMETWKRLLVFMPESPWVPEALVRLGLRRYNRKQWTQAHALFARAYGHNLSVQQRKDMLPAWARILFTHKQYNTLLQIVPRHLAIFEPYDRHWSIHLLARSAEKLDLVLDTFHWRVRLLPFLTPSQQLALQDKLRQQFRDFSRPLLEQILKQPGIVLSSFPYREMQQRLHALAEKSDPTPSPIAASTGQAQGSAPAGKKESSLVNDPTTSRTLPPDVVKRPPTTATVSKPPSLAAPIRTQSPVVAVKPPYPTAPTRTKPPVVAVKPPSMVVTPSVLPTVVAVKPPSPNVAPRTVPPNIPQQTSSSSIAARIPPFPVVERILPSWQETEQKYPANPLVLGVILSHTGKGKLLGEDVRRGVELAKLEYPNVRVVYQDIASSAQRASRAVEKLVREHRVVAIVGPPLAETASAAAQKAQELGVPLISITSKEKYTDLGSYIFRNNITLSWMGRAMARYACHHLSLKKLAVLVSTSDYSRVQAAAFAQEAKQAGATMVRQVSYVPTPKDIQRAVQQAVGQVYENRHEFRVTRQMLANMKAYQKRRLYRNIRKSLKPLLPYQGLFIPTQALIMGQIAAHLAYHNVSIQHSTSSATSLSASYQGLFPSIYLLGSQGWYDPKLFEAGKQWLDGAVLAVRYLESPTNRAYKKFLQRYREHNDDVPSHVTAYTYDAVRIFAYIATKHRLSRRSEFREAVLKIDNFIGPTGKMQVQENREVAAPAHILRAYRGRFHHLTTLPLSSAQTSQKSPSNAQPPSTAQHHFGAF